MARTIAFQLYSARDAGPIEPQLARLAALGYDAVEPWPPAYEDPAALRRMLDARGLACPTFHFPLAELRAAPSRAVEVASTLGAETIVVPFMASEERPADARGWRALGEELAGIGSDLRARDLALAWHNHDFEYVRLDDGSRPIDHLMAAQGLALELDIGWVVRAGADPLAEVTRFAPRLAALHMKDVRSREDTAKDGWAAVGAGTIDWPTLVEPILASAARHLIVEHDAPADWSAVAERSLATLRDLGL